VKRGDDPDSLAARVFEAECEAYPEAIELIASGRVSVDGGRVTIAE
jgi:phosphoribosylglycinamide formyltransferase-1